MSSKKKLYRPAPESMQESTASLVQAQGTSSKDSIKIKQGVLETSKNLGTGRLTSTMKSSKQVPSMDREKPIVVSHDPTLVHSRLKNTGFIGRSVDANDSVRPQVVVSSLSNISKADNSTSRKSSLKVCHVPSKYRSRRAVETKENPSSLLKPAQSFSLSASSSLNASGDQLIRTTQKTSTPSTYQRRELALDESYIAKPTEHSNREKRSPTPLSPVKSESMEFLHCRYLQAKYLELLAQDCKQKKAKIARTQGHFLWEKNNKLVTDLEDLEDEVSELKHLHNLTVHLKQHKSNLAPVVDKIQPALDQYKVLCENLDTTRHHMRLSDIQVPDYADMERALEESRHIIGQMNILSNAKAPMTHQTAEVLEQLSKSCQQEVSCMPEARACTADMLSSVMDHGSLVAQLSLYNSP